MFLNHGEAEYTKGAVHGALLSFAGMCAVYNLLANRKRHEAHLAVNTGVYTVVVLWELWQIRRHLR